METVSRTNASRAYRAYKDGGGTMMRRGVWIGLSVLTILTAGLFVHAQGQQ
jgi:hypothetical protein